MGGHKKVHLICTKILNIMYFFRIYVIYIKPIHSYKQKAKNQQ